MSVKEEVLNNVMAALEREPKIDLHHHPINADFNDGILTLEGAVKDIAAKKLALELAAAGPSVTGIVDRLKVTPVELMTDEVIVEHVRDALIQETALDNCALSIRKDEQKEVLREPPTGRSGAIEIAVENGNVLLEGQVPSLSHKRLAGVLAWWVPGTQNVLNCLEVQPPERDSDDEMIDAVRLVLEKDPFVNADQIMVTSKQRVVTLAGLVASEAEREMVEQDAWYIFGVDKVVNKLEVILRAH
jgi:osmotically-inducible protein OsmY